YTIFHLTPFYLRFLFLFYLISLSSFFFFFNDTATTEIYTLSLHDALPILQFLHDVRSAEEPDSARSRYDALLRRLVSFESGRNRDRKSTRLNSSHVAISYAVFCLKKKKKKIKKKIIKYTITNS